MPRLVPSRIAGEFASARLDGPIYDLLVVGGGINGCGIARDAAGRGLRVLLVEQGDLGSATSSASSKLIHGGLRYLEHFAFRLVRESLVERERLLASAPHLIRPMRFVVPHDGAVRSLWALRLGLFLYDHLARRRRLQGSETLKLVGHPFGTPLLPRLNRGFAYTDCWVDDARLVVLVALDAHERGAEIAPRTRFAAARRERETWRATLEDVETGGRREVRGRIVVNAAGPWAASVLDGALGVAGTKRLRLVKGSHIIVRRLYEGDHAYLLQNTDRRVVFVLPYEEAFTIIGTTDVPYDGDPARVEIGHDEIDYLCACVARFFRRPIARRDVVWHYSGVRPLFDDGAVDARVVTRDYAFDLDAPAGSAPVLSVFGGKLTTFRRLAEHAVDALRPSFPGLGPAWTRAAKLPGGDIAGDDPQALAAELIRRHPFLAGGQALRLARAYGSRCARILDGAGVANDLGRDFGGGLTQAELDHLVTQEWARTAEDVLWRRTKLGLHLDARAGAGVAAYLASRLSRPLQWARNDGARS